jgi:hypothetical protein
MQVQGRRILVTTAGVTLVLSILVLAMVGCNHGIQPVEWPELSTGGESYPLQVTAKQNRDMADLSADDIIRIMRRIGYSDDQILEVGPDVHDALLLSGAAPSRIEIWPI